MTLDELVQAVILKATGKPNTITQTTTKWQKIVGIANAYQRSWQHEPGQHWNSLYDRAYELGTASSRADYEIDPDEVDFISTAKGDDVYIKTTSGDTIKYQLVAYDDLQNYPAGNYCAKVGNNLIFNKSFSENDPEFGGKIVVPIYRNVEELSDPNDDVEVDDPMWLVIMSAAEYIRNDIVKQNQYGNLIAEANQLMKGMINRNRAGQIRRVRGTWRNPGGM